MEEEEGLEGGGQDSWSLYSILTRFPRRYAQFLAVYRLQDIVIIIIRNNMSGIITLTY